MCNKVTLPNVVVAVVVIVITAVVCVQTAPIKLAGLITERFHRCSRETGREQLEREARLRSKVQAYNIVHLFCPFVEYRYLIVAAIAGLVFLCAVVFVYFWYFCDHCPEECEHDDVCAENCEKVKEGAGEERKVTPRSMQGKRK